MPKFVKTVDPDTIQNEAELQRVAAMYDYSPKVFEVTNTEIYMEDLLAPCLADQYGDEPGDIPDWIWDSIRTIVTALYNFEDIEYVDITPYNFIEKEDKIYIIDFGHARYRSTKRPMNWFLQEFLDGENSWNPDFK
jgi:tRNA A-37 threonylcarbamoyl transferase component Bud32